MVKPWPTEIDGLRPRLLDLAPPVPQGLGDSEREAALVKGP